MLWTTRIYHRDEHSRLFFSRNARLQFALSSIFRGSFCDSTGIICSSVSDATMAVQDHLQWWDCSFCVSLECFYFRVEMNLEELWAIFTRVVSQSLFWLKLTDMRLVHVRSRDFCATELNNELRLRRNPIILWSHTWNIMQFKHHQ